MLKRNKKNEEEKSFPGSRIMEQKISSPASSSMTGQEKTIIGEHISIEGSIRGEENLVMAGSMKGKIELQNHHVTVAPTGRVDGEIRAQHVVVSGELKGNITALGKVEITSKADFYGEIRAKSIAVEDGAYIKGMIELDREPHRKSAVTGKPLDKKSSEPAAVVISPATSSKKEP
jgi:cytoskeletal protein CcmA (bactofilin family)